MTAVTRDMRIALSKSSLHYKPAGGQCSMVCGDRILASRHFAKVQLTQSKYAGLLVAWKCMQMRTGYIVLVGVALQALQD